MELPSHAELDEVDLALVALLQQDARMPTADIARSLNISRPTVTRRLDRLLQEGLLHLLAETDLQASGRDFLVVLGVCVRERAVADVAASLARLPEALVVETVTGRYDIEVVAAVADQGALNRLLTETVPGIEGVGERAPGLCVEVLKFESNQVPYSL